MIEDMIFYLSCFGERNGKTKKFKKLEKKMLTNKIKCDMI